METSQPGTNAETGQPVRLHSKDIKLPGASGATFVSATIHEYRGRSISAALFNNKGTMLAYVGGAPADGCKVRIDEEGYVSLWIDNAAFDLAKTCAQRAATELGIKLVDAREAQK